MDFAAAAGLPDNVPGLLIDQVEHVSRIGRGPPSEMLFSEPGELDIAIWRLRDGSALTVNKEIVALDFGQLFDPGNAFPTPRSLLPVLTPHCDLDFVEIVELPIRPVVQRQHV